MPARERAAIKAELTPPFSVSEPERHSSPLVFCSPHSGRIYPGYFLESAQLDAHTLRRSEDCYVDHLFGCVPAYGAPLISALFPRAYLDVNREPYELDPVLFCEPLPEYANPHTTRVIGGLGTIARIVGDGTEIYRDVPSLDAALERIKGLYVPFHAALEGLIERTRDRFGYAILIDCHSMPSNSMSTERRQRPDIVLGDRFGTACDGLLTAFVQRAFSDRGYAVHVNRPYAGGFITEHYGRPTAGVDALQIEINRGLYLNEDTLEPNSGYQQVLHDIEQVVAGLAHDLPGQFDRAAAAE